MGTFCMTAACLHERVQSSEAAAQSSRRAGDENDSPGKQPAWHRWHSCMTQWRRRRLQAWLIQEEQGLIALASSKGTGLACLTALMLRRCLRLVHPYPRKFAIRQLLTHSAAIKRTVISARTNVSPAGLSGLKLISSLIVR